MPTDNVIEITALLDKSKKARTDKESGRVLSSKDIKIIGFLTEENRDLYIKDPVSINKIILFCKNNGITISEKV